MRELDELLLTYLDHHYDAACDAEKAAFSELLALSDPELVSYLLQQQSHPAELDLVIQSIRSGIKA
jgi:succinate dehydrogenase flavin-adding protein (antitoxin of CptAB toxin-antitoxin module)